VNYNITGHLTTHYHDLKLTAIYHGTTLSKLMWSNCWIN